MKYLPDVNNCDLNDCLLFNSFPPLALSSLSCFIAACSASFLRIVIIFPFSFFVCHKLVIILHFLPVEKISFNFTLKVESSRRTMNNKKDYGLMKF